MSADPNAAAPPAKNFTYSVDGIEQTATAEWYRGEHCNFNPIQENLATAQMLVDNVLKGWLPPEPLIGPQTRITAFGSCFARHICEWLSAREFNVLNTDAQSTAHIVRMGEGMVNTFSLLEQIRWALEGDLVEGDYWHGPRTVTFKKSEESRRDTEQILRNTDIFIITLGLSEIWSDKVTGGVFWRGIPKRLFDPERHEFRVASFEENKRNIRAIHDLIRKHRPDAKVIFSVSPIPLVATFRPVSCITANSVSKALLRGAVDEVYREVRDQGAMFYWPSYEFIMDVFENRWRDDRRHVRREVLNFIMTLFESQWCHGHAAPPALAEAYTAAALVTGRVPARWMKRVKAVLDGRDRPGLDALIQETSPSPELASTTAALRELQAEWARAPEAVPG